MTVEEIEMEIINYCGFKPNTIEMSLLLRIHNLRKDLEIYRFRESAEAVYKTNWIMVKEVRDKFVTEMCAELKAKDNQ